MADVDAAILRDLNSAEAYTQRGRIDAAQGNADQAIADFTQAIALDPGLADAYRYRGAVQVKRGDLDAAIADFNLAIERAPDLAPTYLARADALAKRNDGKAALRDLDTAIQLDPNNPVAYVTRGNAGAAGQRAPAIADFSKAIALRPAPAAYYGRGYMLEEHLRPARADFAQALRLDLKMEAARKQLENVARLEAKQAEQAEQSGQGRSTAPKFRAGSSPAPRRPSGFAGPAALRGKPAEPGAAHKVPSLTTIRPP